MIVREEPVAKGLTGAAYEGTWPGIDSHFRLIVVAGLRAKQLLHGSPPRVEVEKGRRRHTTIAIEEVKRGLVNFKKFTTDGTMKEYGGEVFDRTYPAAKSSLAVPTL
ncbi:MAG TPA: DNA-directed RNA polymerase subunit omega [Pyrinomonadaceae bacterium]|nr:DNA-directed RNA polymerase subunit omega [Pyrinomonadaceae bacterium]